MTKELSELNNNLAFVPQPQSPAIVGTRIEYLGSTPETGWLEADGSAVSRLTYVDLFELIGTRYGVGDGATTFNLPNGPRKTAMVNVLTTGDQAWSQVYCSAYCYQDILGRWKINGNFYGNTPGGPGTVNVTIPGVTFDSTQNQAVTLGIGTNSTIAEARSNPNTSVIQLQAQTGRTFWFTHFDIFLENQPVDAFVGADSRFSTFAESLESIPLIKAFSDVGDVSMSIADATENRTGAIRLTSDFEATDSRYGLTLKSQQLFASGVLSFTTSAAASGGFFFQRKTQNYGVTFKGGTKPGISMVLAFANYTPATVNGIRWFLEEVQLGGDNPTESQFQVTVLSTIANVSGKFYWTAIGESP